MAQLARDHLNPMNTPVNPTKAYLLPSVSITTARTGTSSKANELGMRAMQERTYARRGEPYLLIKSPPASAWARSPRRSSCNPAT
jgi:hypothetical protein